MAQFYRKPGLSITVVPTADATTENLFVTLAGALPATPANALGVATADAKNGEALTVVLQGIVPVKAAAAIVAGAFVEVVAAGPVQTKNTGTVVGRALTAADAPGDLVSVLLSSRVV